jgi:hypothetical protein
VQNLFVDVPLLLLATILLLHQAITIGMPGVRAPDRSDGLPDTANDRKAIDSVQHCDSLLHPNERL